jgi:hypothetical protein
MNRSEQLANTIGYQVRWTRLFLLRPLAGYCCPTRLAISFAPMVAADGLDPGVI